MIRRISVAVLTLAVSSSAFAGQGYHSEAKPKPTHVKNNQTQDQDQRQNQVQGQLQGQNQDQVAVGVVSVDSSDNSDYRFPVNTAAAIAASHCPNGGASAQWDRFGFSLGQHRDPVCARLDYKASLLAENTLLADVARLVSRVPTAKDPKSPTSNKIENSIAESISAAILKNNVRIDAQNTAIEESLKPGWFDWMNEVPLLSVFAPNR